jgi:DNA-binding transcriptional LysR family regulator
MNDRLKTLRLFVRVAYTRSFSQAGRELGLSQPSASRLIADLEKDIGGTLLQRHTRAVSLTETGTAYLARVEQILADIDDANHQARDSDELRGHLKIGASSSFATRELVPRLSRFATRHPELTVDICIDDERQDLVTESIDLALRVGELRDSGTVACRIGRWPLALAASPGYLQAAGVPQVPDDLASHRLIMRRWRGLASSTPASSRFAANSTTDVSFRSCRIGMSARSRSMPSFQAGAQSRRPRERSPNFWCRKWRSQADCREAAPGLVAGVRMCRLSRRGVLQPRLIVSAGASCCRRHEPPVSRR